MLFDFQKALTEWAILKGRSALFADCGMGKTYMQLVWAENVVRQTNKAVLILTPLAVSQQTVEEGEKFGIEVRRTTDGTIKPGINVTNYDQLHKYDPAEVVAVVCDESSILKHFGGATQKLLTRFVSKLPYRLLCTATAAPNDFHELGTSSEALGVLGYTDMLSRFFALADSGHWRQDAVRLAQQAKAGHHYARLAYRVSQQIGQWRLKPHAEIPFWRWVCSWARACRSPADLGFAQDGFALPALMERHYIVTPSRPPDGMLFTIPAFGLSEERDERRRTLDERVDLVRRLVDHPEPAVVWCHLNVEGDRLAEAIRGSVQVKGSDSNEAKEEAYRAFSRGQVRVIITKPKIGAWGLNWQHCAHVVTFASHSYEQYYQSVRRCWRFGQHHPVTVDIISTEGEVHVRDNMVRKMAAADQMFTSLVRYMHEAEPVTRVHADQDVDVPSWL
jgi:hypothetical protein